MRWVYRGGSADQYKEIGTTSLKRWAWEGSGDGWRRKADGKELQ